MGAFPFVPSRFLLRAIFFEDGNALDGIEQQRVTPAHALPEERDALAEPLTTAQSRYLPQERSALAVAPLPPGAYTRPLSP